MKGEERCERCDLPLSMCEHAPKAIKAQSEEHARRREIKDRPDVYPSRFHSMCPQCGGHINEGDPITSSAGGWVHADPKECDGTDR